MKKLLLCTLIIASIVFSSGYIFASDTEIALPKTIERDGRIFEIYEPSRRTNSAEMDINYEDLWTKSDTNALRAN